MSLMRWRNEVPDPFQDFEDLHEEIDRLFDVMRYPEQRGIFERSYSPQVDVVENPDSYEVMCDVPGIGIRDIDVSVSGNVLTLKGEKKVSEKNENHDVYRGELASGRFQRTLQLPLAVDSSKVEAVLKDGVLRITLPKQEELKPHQISVKAK